MLVGIKNPPFNDGEERVRVGLAMSIPSHFMLHQTAFSPLTISTRTTYSIYLSSAPKSNAMLVSLETSPPIPAESAQLSQLTFRSVWGEGGPRGGGHRTR